MTRLGRTTARSARPTRSHARSLCWATSTSPACATGERIRDKIAASKKKGLWMGGVVPLGYRVADRKLLIETEEARTVRLIFERYLALQSLPALQRELRERGVTTRTHTMSDGRVVGGGFLTNGPLAHILHNRVYLGELNHKGQSYPADHKPIVARELFEAVQDQISANLVTRRNRRTASDAMLVGRIFDDAGHAMTPTYAVKNGVRYRYYASCVLAQGRKEEAGSVPRVSAPEIEAAVRTAIQSKQDATSKIVGDDQVLQGCITRVVLRPRVLEIVLVSGCDEVGSEPITVPWSPLRTRPARELVAPAPDASRPAKPIRTEERARLIDAIATARRWSSELLESRITSTDEKCSP